MHLTSSNFDLSILQRLRCQRCVQPGQIFDSSKEYLILCKLRRICVLTKRFKSDQRSAGPALGIDLYDTTYETLLLEGAYSQFNDGENVAYGVFPDICVLPEHLSRRLSRL